jgi:gas vesicle structural protein
MTSSASRSTSDVAPQERDATLLELLDRLIDKGVVLTGDITISVADVDLIVLGLNVVLASVERAQQLHTRLELGPAKSEIQRERYG